MSSIKIKAVAIAASKQVFLSSMVILLLAIAGTPLAQAQTYEVLYRFHGKADGGAPDAGVIRDAAGNLYGTTAQGGDLQCDQPQTLGCGVVFKLSPTRKETVLHTFTGGADGGFPEAGLLRDTAGNLYGTALSGGDLNCAAGYEEPGCGVVFKLDTAGKETVLYTFTGGAEGAFPDADVIRDAAGNLYGIASGGGDYNCFPRGGGCGVAFKLDTTGKETVLHTFTKGGSSPVIQDAAGNLYGAAGSGDTYGSGVVFKLSTKTRKFTVLYKLIGGGADGSFLSSLVRDAEGNLYGTTAQGGDLNCFPPYGCGVAFKLDTAGKETVLHTFHGGADGGFPNPVIRDVAGNLYGTTGIGGDLNCQAGNEVPGCGVVFKLDTTGKETVLHTFTEKAGGIYPTASLIRDTAGNLYGTTIEGGDLKCFPPSGCGVVFKVTP
jgi:uncharacterized repeat protein (TIGR03803 family)